MVIFMWSVMSSYVDTHLCTLLHALAFIALMYTQTLVCVCVSFRIIPTLVRDVDVYIVHMYKDVYIYIVIDICAVVTY